MDFDKLKKSNLISRDFSWLNFNYRVFDQVKNQKRNILDRLKFLSIVSSNFDEFFEVRVGSLYNYIDNKLKRYRWLIISFICFIFSCLSKGMAVVFPLILILVNFWESKDIKPIQAIKKAIFTPRRILELAPFFIISF